ncbi:type I polyketide synthase [Amycolatopsis mediterranei S699]|uniref:Type I polyketide synthase n=3 Tax=Amycolatopsis mediterranei TaxID=33910 RepID=A0A0H3DA11_AMYMU|nr:type I polyketide synthase [Amycolatopsis mediterranei]ADJ46374.1 type I polyketide synthase [Amycolatopsis mediterranei U32]AEK43168.1 type I polyketide synthase [Amycolatopsis mediterranei S699]AFO78085.1 type I polyketide synthase [Amycolatopsis mediterranei S699]AGT85213.1 type I polyketide synthase [Amycolatopsis mediterranei RB]KDO06387.1 erythronolide synthase [Amycolatopsis mediterranei]
MRLSKDDSVPAELVVAVSPLRWPSARGVAAAARGGGLGVLDLTARVAAAADELALLGEWGVPAFGVRLARPADLPDAVTTVLLTEDAACTPRDFPGRRVLAEVTSRAAAVRAVAAGADGLIARGHECGGRIGELSTFVLLQALLDDDGLGVPVWAAGGIGPHTAAAAVAGGAAGVVVDTQLALLPEAELPSALTTAVTGLDGSETTVADGVRVLARRGTEPLEAGQDVFLATRFRDRWGTVTAAVRGLAEAVGAALRVPDAVLGPGSAGSRAFGTALPVVQGPMTRVSDQPAFAAEVAAGGALPFIALALSGPEQTREVLERTRAAVGDAPWGVGVLGFAADDVKAAQLAVIRELRPTHAIIAGGRPAQAVALEDAGIATFLHVPSPGLLKQFLEAGARKFVFEGSECGGHVGPRTSFPLWEAQLGVLADFLAATPAAAADLQLLFAGGIHDERSAAMVAALAAPVAARGAAIGVLMGTAYLFTREAVDAGAVLPLFQRRLLEADRTDLLETAPGHATRCVRSPFTEEYAAIKADLAERGVPSRDAWEHLETLNVGRLRLASKGIERVGAELRDVAEDRQLAEGMFMAGEVAVLRSAVTTIADLHHSVGEGANAFLRARAAVFGVTEAEPPAPEPLEIAIVGMACMFPQAPDLAAFWANVLAGADAVTEVPPQRWDTALYYDPDGQGERTPSRWGGFLPEIGFDPLKYGIPPSSLASIEPVQLLALEAAHRALADAGYADRAFDRTRTSVVFGAEAGSDLSNAMTLRSVLPSYLGALPSELDERLPKITEDSFPGVLANVIAGRIANRLDLGGANYTVDAACASSLTAVDVACKELTAGTSDLVLCGGADLHNGINDYLLFASAHALSPTGRSATFDSAADGIALGEGVACIALKRLADAERDGDRVYAVIKGVGAASDGRALGLTAPRPEGQHTALTRAYRNAGVSPARVGLVEAHGTGTVVGDRTELGTLTKVFTEAGAAPGGCTIGSVKSQIGHTKCAAGLAGLIKAALAVHTGVKPPTLHLTSPNPAWDPSTSPFVFQSAAQPWTAPPAERLAGVSAFGFGGTNFHVVLGAHDSVPPAQAADEWPAELFTFTTESAARELLAMASEVSSPWRLRDLALAAAQRAQGRPARLAVVASTVDELTGLLREALAGHDARGVFRADDAVAGEVAVLFPGQGSQQPGMFAELFVTFPELQRYLRLDPATAEVVFGPAVFGETARRDAVERVTDTRVAQPALGLAGLAAFRLLSRAGVRPAMLGGHSYGELTALAAAGALTPEALLHASHARAGAIVDAVPADDPGAMAAVSAGAAETGKVLADAGLDAVVLANHNSPKQTVISGPTADVEAAVGHLRAAGLGAKRIQVACAFHSSLVAPAGEAFGRALDAIGVVRPAVPVYGNRTAGPYPADPDAIRGELAAQLGAPVRFVEQVEAMYAAGARVFVEAGPGAVLAKQVAAILGDRPHRTVGFEQPGRRGLPGFLGALAQLAVAGVTIETGWLFRGRDAVDAFAAPRPKRPGWTVDGHLLRTADGTIPAGALRPAERVSFGVTAAAPQAATSEAMVADFLRTSREMIAAQRDVLLGFLGTEAPLPVSAPIPVPVIEPPVVVPVAAPRTASVLETVVEVIGARTGYPVEMIEPDLDLEADLSVDSIKRAEIAGELASRLGLAGGDVEEFAKARTAAAIAELIGDERPAAEPEAASVLATVVAVIGERTGYPVEMIEPDLDLEADLSVDSIKRAEIAGELATRLNLDTGGDVEELAKARTAAAIAELIDGERPNVALVALDAPKATLGALSAPKATLGRLEPAEPAPLIVAPKRLVMAEIDLPAAEAPDVTGRKFLLLGRGPLAEAVRAHLTGLGASAEIADEVRPGFDGILRLPGDGPVLPAAFPQYQAALARKPAWLLTAGPGEGLRGFHRSLAREYPDTLTRVVELFPAETPEVQAAALVEELSTTDREPVVVREGPHRRGFRMAEQDLGPLGSSGAGPAGDGAAEAAAIGLDRDSVVLLVGGAKGITARFAATLAGAARCRIELLGRTPVPAAEDEHPQAMTTEDLRAALISAGLKRPAEIERTVRRIRSEREVRQTLARLEALGSPVRYQSVDMLDAEAVHRAVKEIHAEHGRLDGIVYAAGVIEDKLVAEKTPESFERVYGTKVDGARTLLEATADLPDEPAFVVLFGSIAATLGNRGQTDYAAANDALEALGRRWPAGRAVTVHWGPWAPTGEHDGMVTPELMRDYARRGIALIDPEEGSLGLLRELAWGRADTGAVVHTASGW